MKDTKQGHIAYFSMEIALNDELKNFAGGLGVLAGDTLLSGADLGLPLVGISLLYHRHDQANLAFDPKGILTKLPETVSINIEDRRVKICIWQTELKSRSGRVPVYFLSAYHPDNKRWDRDLTKNLYAGDAYTRLGQEAILGIGGYRALTALGYRIDHYHLNEGHAALLTLEHMREKQGDAAAVRRDCSFTTHTAINSGHDYFDYELASKMLGPLLPANIQELSLPNSLGMTELALKLCGRSNGVSRIHAQVSREKFPGFDFLAITNGIHHSRWAGQPMTKLLDSYLPGWQAEPERLTRAKDDLPAQALNQARQEQKTEFIAWLNRHREFYPLSEMDDSDLFNIQDLTIGFARRLVPYKRVDLILKDIDRLRVISQKGKIQLVFAGNRYDKDLYSENLVARIGECAQALRGQVRVVLIPRYDLNIARHLVAGCDLWLNNPVPGTEASGTSGMKAAINGVPSLSTMDGWWKEAYVSDIRSGWGFGEIVEGPDRDLSDHHQLMSNLENIIDCYYRRPDEWQEKMRHSIALIAYFNTHRMLKEYQEKMWS